MTNFAAVISLISIFVRFSAAQYDIVIYGATPAGISAAFAAAREGSTVALLHPLNRIGGMMTNGLGETDVGNKSVIGGLAHDVFLKIGAKYGSTGPVYVFEPHVSLSVFQDMLTEPVLNNRVKLVTGVTLSSVTYSSGTTTISSISVVPTTVAINAGDFADWSDRVKESEVAYSGSVFLDTSYEGDLIKMAGVSLTYGRESNSTYNERYAGRLQVPNSVGGHQFSVPVNYTSPTGGVLPLITNIEPGVEGEGDTKVQAYNFRLCLTTNVSNQVPIAKPSTYDPSYWELFRRYIAAKWPNATSAGISPGDFMNLSPIPNKKTDVNNNGAISTGCIGCSWEWPSATPAKRNALWLNHSEYTKGFLYFLGNDQGIPLSLRTQMLTWGLAADEFEEFNNWPEQLYVREGYRMISDFVFTEHDRETNKTKVDSIGLFSYNIDTHNSQRFPQGDYVRNEGDVEIDGPLGPGQLPFRMLLPKKSQVSNLLAVVPCSASHLGYGTIRLEPQFLILGESSGVAASQFIASNLTNIQDLDIPTLQARLRTLGQIIDL
jgi:hypothetical protein